MRRSWVVVVTLVLSASSAWATPWGPGGRIYLTRTWYRSLGDCTTELLRLDVDSNWDVTTNYGAIAQVVNSYNVNTNYHLVTSPEILHARSFDNLALRGGDGSVFMASFTDNADHTAYWKVTPTGTVTTLHPGTGRSASGAGPRTAPYSAMLVDREGRVSGRADTMMHWGGGYSSGAWYDVNGNDDLTDDTPAQAWAYPAYDKGGSNDAEAGGRPTSDCATFSQYSGYVWSDTYRYIYHTPYTGTADCHTWGAKTTFYDYGAWPVGVTGTRFRMGDSGIAVADTDGDGNEDVYFLSTDLAGYDITSPSIIRMADLDGSGRFDCAVTDMARIIYDSSMLAGTTNDFGSAADLEILRDPLTGRWTLLILERGSAYAARDARIIAFALSDNGDFAGGDDAFKVILAGLDTGTGQNATGRVFWGVEFDADPAAAPVPEPATLLLLGSGALGALGWARRRRMR